MPIKFFPPLSGNINWGEINGNIVDQTDLKSDLDSKSDATHNHDAAYEPADSNIQSHLASSSNPHAVTKSQIALANVTDDAQLKRSPSDFSSFTEKAAPVNADIILIEDSADAGNKKKVLVGNIQAGLPAAAANDMLYFDGTDWAAADKLKYFTTYLESRIMGIFNGDYIDDNSYCLEVMGENNFIGFASRGNKIAAYLQTYDYNGGEIALKILVGNALSAETDVWFIKCIRASNLVEVFKIDFEGKMFSEFLKTTQTHPGAYKALYVDTATGKIYSQDAAAGSPSWGNIAGTLSDQTDLQAALDDKAGKPGWGLPNGGYIFDGVDDDIVVTNDNNLNLGTGDFSFGLYIEADTTGGLQFVVSKRQASTVYYRIMINTDGTIELRSPKSGTQILVKSQSDITGSRRHIMFCVDRANSAKVYVDGIDDTAGTPTNTANDIDNTGTLIFGSQLSAYYFSGEIYFIRMWNRALLQEEVLACYNNGLPMQSGIEFADQWGSQTTQTSGTLTIGKRYVIENFVAGDDFTNVGASGNSSGVEFIATGAVPAAWSNASVLKQIGCMVDYRPENAFPYSWWDASDKQLHGEVNGAFMNEKFQCIKAAKNDITGDTALIDIVPPGYRIASILIEETAGKTVTGGVDIGTTASGSEVVNAEVVGANSVVMAALSGTFFGTSSAQTLYISAATAWNSASVNVTVVMEKAI